MIAEIVFFFCNVYIVMQRWIIFAFYPLLKKPILLPIGRRYGLNFVTNEKDIVCPKLDICLNMDRKTEKELAARVAIEGTLGLAEIYIDGLFQVDDVRGFIEHVVSCNYLEDFQHPVIRVMNYLNLQTPDKAFEAADHYKAGDDVFKLILDPYMQYSCAYWRNASDLNTAQIDKMALVAEKLKLSPGMKVLDIGFGNGGLAKYLIMNYGVTVVGVTISKEQTIIAEKLCEGLPVDFRICDYRDLPEHEKYDRVVSVAMMEHVGHKNYKDFFKVVSRVLKDNGLFLLHTIGRNSDKFPGLDPFYHKYIFRNFWFPHHSQLLGAIKGTSWVVEDWHNFGYDYYKTMKAWEQNFEDNWHLLQHKYGEPFKRTWLLYFYSAQATFKHRKLQLWQIVFSKGGLSQGYQSVR